MKFLLAMAALVTVCVADIHPRRSSLTFPPHSASFSHFPIAPQPKSSSRNTFFSHSAPHSTYSPPRPSYSSPLPTYSPYKPSYSPPRPTYSPHHHQKLAYYAKPVVPILVDERKQPENGAYSFVVKTGDGINRQETGKPFYTKEGISTAVTGSYSYILPDGQLFELHYIADENGFQPQSSYLPVAPAFPHPIPAHALEQIRRGREEHAARERKDRQRQSQRYSASTTSYGLL